MKGLISMGPTPSSLFCILCVFFAFSVFCQHVFFLMVTFPQPLRQTDRPTICLVCVHLQITGYSMNLLPYYNNIEVVKNYFILMLVVKQ